MVRQKSDQAVLQDLCSALDRFVYSTKPQAAQAVQLATDEEDLAALEEDDARVYSSISKTIH